MQVRIVLAILLGLATVTVPMTSLAQYGGALHYGGWANGTGVPLPPQIAAEAPEPVLLALTPQTTFSAAGTSAFAYLYINAPYSEARARMRIIRVSDSVVVVTSVWTTTLTNRVLVSGLVVGTTYRVEVELEALTPAWVSVPWFTLIASYVQPSKYDPPFDYDLQG